MSGSQLDVRPPARRVAWDSDVKGSEGDEDVVQDPRPAPQARRTSMVGESGYVSQLLTEHLHDASEPDEKEQKFLREQSPKERRASIMAVDSDVDHYMHAGSAATESSALRILQEPVPVGSSDLPFGKAQALPDAARPTSTWKPSDILENEKFGVRTERSWLGTYIVGKDYWAEDDGDDDIHAKEVQFSEDAEKASWYDLTLREDDMDSKLQSMKALSQLKTNALKEEMDEDFEEKRMQRRKSAATARQTATDGLEELPEEFKECFKEVAKTKNFSKVGTHVSMEDGNKWLEAAGILDHTRVTLLHTGLAFLASGGARNRGLNMEDFVYYLEMVASNFGKPLRDVMRRLISCKRPEYLYP